MSNDKYNDKELAERFGLRESGNPIFYPQEQGYRCPKGHAHITWSEFKEHIWCYVCAKDFHYAKDCVLIENVFMPKDLPEQPRIIKGIKVFAPDGNTFNNIPKELLDKTRV